MRSQMDVRICFRVRERKDVDLILGQGMLTAGWNAHTLNAPGKFLIAAAEHDTPRRARAYLVTDQAVAERPTATPTSGRRSMRYREQAIEQQQPDGTARHVSTGRREPRRRRGRTPEAILWAALSLAPDDGTSRCPTS